MSKTKNKLLEQTQQYWLISSTWNRRIDGDLTITDAMSHMKGIITTNNPRKALAHSAGALLSELILQPKKSKRGKKVSKPIPLQKTIA